MFLALSSGIDRFNAVIGKAVIWLILASLLISAGNALVRKTFAVSSNAWLEVQWYLFGAAFLLAAAYTLRENEHIRVDILYGKCSRRTQHMIDLFGHVFFLMPFTILMAVYLLPYVSQSYQSNEVSNSAGGLILWPAKSLLLIGFLLLIIQGLSEIIKKIAILRGVMEDPHSATQETEDTDAEAAAASSGEGQK